MKFIYRGVFSKGLDTQEQFGVVFNGREPSDVREGPAIRWMQDHPDYEQQPDEVVVPVEDAPKPVKKAKKAK